MLEKLYIFPVVGRILSKITKVCKITKIYYSFRKYKLWFQIRDSIPNHIVLLIASIMIWENKITESSIESFAAKIRTEKDQAMVNGLLKALEKRESEWKPRQILKRLSEALKQVRSTQNKKKKA